MLCPRSRAFPALLLAALLLAACRGSVKDGPSSITGTPDVRARLTAMNGDVKLKRLGTADYAPATKGAGLVIGDAISTGPGGNATLTFSDGSTAAITPRSLVTIEAPANSAADGIGVQRGRVDVEILSAGKDGFLVRTPGAEANPHTAASEEEKKVVR